MPRPAPRAGQPRQRRTSRKRPALTVTAACRKTPGPRLGDRVPTRRSMRSARPGDRQATRAIRRLRRVRSVTTAPLALHHGDRLAGIRGCGRPAARPADDVAREQRKRGATAAGPKSIGSKARTASRVRPSSPAASNGPAELQATGAIHGGSWIARARRGRSPAKTRSTPSSNGLVWSVPASAVSASVPATRPPGTRGGFTSRTLGEGGSPPFGSQPSRIARSLERASAGRYLDGVCSRSSMPGHRVRKPAPAPAPGWACRPA